MNTRVEAANRALGVAGRRSSATVLTCPLEASFTLSSGVMRMPELEMITLLTADGNMWAILKATNPP